jgi:hypothetical protein
LPRDWGDGGMRKVLCQVHAGLEFKEGNLINQQYKNTTIIIEFQQTHVVIITKDFDRQDQDSKCLMMF